MKRLLILFSIVVMLVFASTLTVLGQEPTDEPPVSVAPVATSAVEDVTEPPAEVIEKASDSEGLKVIAVIGWTAFLLVLLSLLYVVLLLLRELRKSAAAGDQSAKNLLAFVNATMDMLPTQSFLQLVDKLDQRAKATPTVGEIDDRIIETLKAYVHEMLDRSTPPAETPPAEPRTFIQEAVAA